jgi:hypothetical protein
MTHKESKRNNYVASLLRTFWKHTFWPITFDFIYQKEWPAVVAILMAAYQTFSYAIFLVELWKANQACVIIFTWMRGHNIWIFDNKIIIKLKAYLHHKLLLVCEPLVFNYALIPFKISWNWEHLVFSLKAK